jgi:hypothetical protein
VIGQAINVSVGAAGFVHHGGTNGLGPGRLPVSAALDLTLAWLLVPVRIEGAAAAQAITIAASNFPARAGAAVRRDLPVDRTYARLVVPAAVCDRDGGCPRGRCRPKWYVQLVAVAVLGGIAYVPALLARPRARREGGAPQRRRQAGWPLTHEAPAHGGGSRHHAEVRETVEGIGDEESDEREDLRAS